MLSCKSKAASCKGCLCYLVGQDRNLQPILQVLMMDGTQQLEFPQPHRTSPSVSARAPSSTPSQALSPSGMRRYLQQSVMAPLRSLTNQVASRSAR